MIEPISSADISFSNFCDAQYLSESIVSQGVSGMPTKMTSFREEAYASKRPYLCKLISDFISWIKELFCTSNKKCEIEHPPLTYERLIQRAEASINARLDLPSIIFPYSGFDYPLHLVVTIKFNEQLVAMPLSLIKNEGEFNAFKLEAARVAREALQEVDLSSASHCFYNTSAEGAPAVYNARSSGRNENLKNPRLLSEGDGLRREIGLKGLALYTQEIVGSDVGRLEELRSFFGEG